MWFFSWLNTHAHAHPTALKQYIGSYSVGSLAAQILVKAIYVVTWIYACCMIDCESAWLRQCFQGKTGTFGYMYTHTHAWAHTHTLDELCPSGFFSYNQKKLALATLTRNRFQWKHMGSWQDQGEPQPSRLSGGGNWGCSQVLPQQEWVDGHLGVLSHDFLPLNSRLGPQGEDI